MMRILIADDHERSLLEASCKVRWGQTETTPGSS